MKDKTYLRAYQLQAYREAEKALTLEENMFLIQMPVGTGKTYIAFELIKQLASLNKEYKVAYITFFKIALMQWNVNTLLDNFLKVEIFVICWSHVAQR